MKRTPAALLLTVLFTGLAAVAAPPPKLTGKAWLDMDYGPYKADTVELAEQEGNFAYKAVVIPLNRERTASIVFDEDNFRYAAGWEGWLNLSGVVYDGKHWAYPKTSGPIVYSNPVGPGWANPAATSAEDPFKDPRFRGNDDKPYGPMPHAWAKWNGLYLHGETVVLSYSIGGVEVLETPALEKIGGLEVFTRTLNIAPSTKPMTVQIAEDRLSQAQIMRVAAGGLQPAKETDASSTIITLGYTPGAGEIKTEEPKSEPAKEAGNAKVTEGLVARYTFDKVEDKQIANAAGKSNALTVQGGRVTAGVEGDALLLDANTKVSIEDSKNVKLGLNDHTIAAWIKTDGDGTIVARAPAEGNWTQQGRTFFIRGGKLTFDVGWVGALNGKTKIADDKWHHVAVTFNKGDKKYRLYVDGQLDGEASLDVDEEVADHVIKVGFTSPNFPRGSSQLNGLIDDLRIYNRVISAKEVATLANAELPPDAPEVTFTIGGDPLGVGYVGDAKATWSPKGGAARLTIAPHDKPVRIKVLVWRGNQDKLTTFAGSVGKAAAPADLSKLTQGGPPRWDKTLVTKAVLGTAKKDSPYAIDYITWPDDNPYKSWMRFGGFDFFEGGTKAAICTWSGDVWIVDGIAPGEIMSELKWRRIATGMFQPLGVKIVDGDIYVSCRDQITKLVDLNGDGETDFYQNFNNDHQVTEHFHEFAMDLQTDKDGNFYYAKSARHARDSLVQQHGTLIKVSKDGKKSQIIANGYRAANGVGVGPNGEFFTSDQEGHWMPANRINLVKQGSFSGNMYSYHMGDKPKDYDRPIVWLPKQIDRSPAEQVWVSSDKWGLPKNSLISLSYGTGYIQHVMYEMVEGIDPNVYVQGAFHRLPVQFPTGVMRGRFHDGDGQLYTCGLFGWSSQQTRPGGFFRVRFVGKSYPVPTKFLAATDGIVLEFSEPMDEELAEDVGSFLVEQWDYKWSGSYGSPEFKLSDGSRGRDKIDVKAAHISKDKRRIWIEIPKLQKSMQVRIKYDLETKTGDVLTDDLYGSIFVIPDRSGAAMLEPAAE